MPTPKKVNKAVQPDTSSVNKGAAKVAAAVAKVYEIVSKNGSIVTQCVTSAQSVYKGEAIPDADLKSITEEVARLREWTPANAKTRKSEVRTILKVYNRLDEAIKAYSKKHKSFTWHTAIKLARCLNREPALVKALRLMDAQTESITAAPIKVVTSAVTRVMGLKTKAKKIVEFQAGLFKLCKQTGIDWE